MDEYQQQPQKTPVYHAPFMEDDPDTVYDEPSLQMNSTTTPAEEAVPQDPALCTAPSCPRIDEHCLRCGGEMLENEHFCHSCGAPRQMTPQFCPQCGAVLPQGHQFCGQCGHPCLPQTLPYSPPPQEEKNPGLGLGIAGMIVAIHGLALSWFPIFGLIICIPGLVMSIIAKKKGCQGQAKAGIICSSIGLGIQLIFLVAMIASIAISTQEIALYAY